MVELFLCDDNQMLLTQYKTIIEHYLDAQRLVGKIAVESTNGLDLLIYLRSELVTGGIYFLDIDLHNERMNGIDLALKIRDLDPFAQIVFISTHAELLKDAVQRQVNTLNFIYKDDGQVAVREALEHSIEIGVERRAQQLPDDDDYFEYEDGGLTSRIEIDKINFFETSSKARHIIMHCQNGEIEMMGNLRILKEKLPSFYSVHKSVLVNPVNISAIDKKQHQLSFENGDTCIIAYRQINKVAKLVGIKS